MSESGEKEPLLAKTHATGLEEVGWFCGGVINDYQRRFTPELLRSDWVTDAFNAKTLSSALFMFFATFTSTLALGEAIFESTKGLIGLNEYLMMNSAAGMLHAILGCQPLLVLRPTGPVTLLFEKLTNVASDWELPFWPFFAWTGIFVGLYMLAIAAFELSKYFKYVTAFTDGIFATFIGFIYINDGLQGIVRTWHDAERTNGKMEAAEDVISINMTIVIAALALWLSTVQSSKLFTFEVRSLIVDYALTIAFFVSILAAWWLNTYVCPILFIDTSKSGFNTTADRSWLADFSTLSPMGVLVAAISAVPIVIFFYLDQNISSALCQAPDMRLRKGTYFHSSFGFMGALNFLGPLVGLPFVTGSLPHSPQFVTALTDYDTSNHPVSVRENRLAPFLCYMLLGLPLLFPSALSVIPKAAVSSTLIFVGVQGVQSTQLYERCMCMLMERKHHPTDRTYSRVKPAIMHTFTAIQVGLVAACWVCSSVLGLAFPFFVASFVPIRWKLLPQYFSEEDLSALDDEDDDESSSDDEGQRRNSKMGEPLTRQAARRLSLHPGLKMA
eukprot:TRINITY_DN33622_c0_g1_i1.p1 TRINITY_DN33622_c0_g1~~TRINITY_DN33622_c0_g1_i1.p1  ORF type:complete len:557 (-),score=106.42 TRINITY_DN33622_c0_g1_i1:89-1759(-)